MDTPLRSCVDTVQTIRVHVGAAHAAPPSRRHLHCHAAQPSRHRHGRNVDGSSGRAEAYDLAERDDDSARNPSSAPEVTVLEFPASPADASNVVRTSGGLHRTPLSGGVANATARCELPSPSVAVRNLVEQAQFAHLCTCMSGMHHRRAGYPFGTVVDFAADGAGYPIFSLSPLAIHTRNIMEDPRCSLVMQMPGWSGLANARVTIFGDVYALPKELQGAAAEIFHQKMSVGDDAKGRYVSGTPTYFRMDRILDIYFVGGFGTVQWLDVEEYTSAQPDQIVVCNPNATLQALNQAYSEAMRKALSCSGAADDAAFISIDKLGADIRMRRGGEYSVERVGFDIEVESLEDALTAVQRVLNGLTAKPHGSEAH